MANTITEEQVMAALSTVNDPDLNRDLVSLGFIENLKIVGSDVFFTVMLTTPACPMKDRIQSDCESALRRDVPGIVGIHLEFGARMRYDARIAEEKTFSFKNVVAVGAGKGGVGKSTVAVNIAVFLAASGAQVGLLDADIYGPNIPAMLGTDESPRRDGEMILPVEKHGLKMMSMGFLIPADQALVWRGPMIHRAINQLISQVVWGELDYLIIDLPPGTGDAQMSLAEQLPLTGAVVVTTPQRVSVSDTRRGIHAFRQLGVEILGVVENMAGPIFGSGAGEAMAEEMGINFLGRLPLDATVSSAGENGRSLLLDDSDTEVHEAFRAVAGQVAAGVSVLTAI